MLLGTLDDALADDVPVLELVDVLPFCVHAVDGGLDRALFLVCRVSAVSHRITCSVVVVRV